MAPDRHQGFLQPPLKHAAADDDATADEKVENPFLTSIEPHWGHSV
jgi:hypothetical protein